MQSARMSDYIKAQWSCADQCSLRCKRFDFPKRHSRISPQKTYNTIVPVFFFVHSANLRYLFVNVFYWFHSDRQRTTVNKSHTVHVSCVLSFCFQLRFLSVQWSRPTAPWIDSAVQGGGQETPQAAPPTLWMSCRTPHRLLANTQTVKKDISPLKNS